HPTGERSRIREQRIEQFVDWTVELRAKHLLESSTFIQFAIWCFRLGKPISKKKQEILRRQLKLPRRIALVRENSERCRTLRFSQGQAFASGLVPAKDVRRGMARVR